MKKVLLLAGGAAALNAKSKAETNAEPLANYHTMLSRVGEEVYTASTAVKGGHEMGTRHVHEELVAIDDVPMITNSSQKPFLDRSSFKDGDFKQDVKNLIKASEDGPDNHRITSRFIGTKNHGDAVEYLTKQLSDLGLAVYQQKWQKQVGTRVVDLTNIIGTYQGTHGTDAETVLVNGMCPQNTCSVVIGAHYDSIPQSRPPRSGEFLAEIDAPGADDNGSGVAALLEAAKHITSAAHTKKCSIFFALFDGEEEGLWGSGYFAESIKGLCAPRAAVILDQVSWKADSLTKPEFIYETKGETESKKGLIRTCAYSSAVDGFDTKQIWANYHGWGSDHMPFIERGVDAVLMISKDNLDAAEKFGHTSDDTVKNPNWEYGNAMSVQAAECIERLAEGEAYIQSSK